MLKCLFCSISSVGGSSHVPPPVVDLCHNTNYHRTFQIFRIQFKVSRLSCHILEECLRLRLSSLGFFNTLSALFTSPSASKVLKLLKVLKVLDVIHRQRSSCGHFQVALCKTKLQRERFRGGRSDSEVLKFLLVLTATTGVCLIVAGHPARITAEGSV